MTLDTAISVVIVMGVAGSGKTTIGRLLASELDWRFVDADSLHTEANIAKMHRGEPLTDEDREPWLQRVKARVDESIRSREPSVVACSSLKERYRQLLGESDDAVRFVYLRASASLLRARLETRTAHFAGVDLLQSQLATLEEPAAALIIDAALAPSQIVATIVSALDVRPRP